MIYFSKEKQLISNLNVASYTINESMQAGDWTLALNHLMKLEEYGPVFNIKLFSEDNKSNFSGPFGEEPFCIGSLCNQISVSNNLKLNGCMKIFGAGELTTLLLFILLTSGLFFTVFTIFRSKILIIIETISKSLKEMRGLDATEHKAISGEFANISEIESIKEYILLLLKEAEESSKSITLNQISTQVAHDIRSPLTALDVAIKDLADLPEQKRVLIRNAVNRIRDIANNLLKHYRENQNNNDSELFATSSMVVSMLDIIISEKRTQYSDRSIQFDLLINQNAYNIFIDVSTTEFKRMISNIINNSVESIEDQGNIIVSLAKDKNNAIIEISDSGCGMTQEVIDTVLSNINSSSKSDGHGLGLKHAYSLIESLGGTIKIWSKEKNGTKIIIQLSLTEPPTWYTQTIKIPKGGKVIVFDDDSSIHEVWSQRFNTITEVDHEIEIMHFSSIIQLRSFFNNLKFSLKNLVFLIDYEIINAKETGLDIIEEFHIRNQAILVTSRHEEREIILRCEKLNVPLLPKSMAAFISIQTINLDEIYDAILIDDDLLIHEIWKMSAQLAGKKLSTYLTFEDFMKDINNINFSTAIYIDINLQNGIRGDEIAKNIYSHGFTNIHLATGYDKTQFLYNPWIKEVVGKEPPWGFKLE